MAKLLGMKGAVDPYISRTDARGDAIEPRITGTQGVPAIRALVDIVLEVRIGETHAPARPEFSGILDRLLNLFVQIISGRPQHGDIFGEHTLTRQQDVLTPVGPAIHFLDDLWVAGDDDVSTLLHQRCRLVIKLGQRGRPVIVIGVDGNLTREHVDPPLDGVQGDVAAEVRKVIPCLLYTSPSPRD